MKETMVKYLSGLLDADGSLSFAFKADKNREDVYFVGLVLKLDSSTAVDKHGFVESLPEITGMGTVVTGGAKRQFRSWVVSKRSHLEMLLPRLTKHQVIKAKHWQWLFDTWRSNKSGREGGWTCSGQERELLRDLSKESRRTRVGPLKPKNHPTWGWLAGYLDGDGTYHYRSFPNTSGGLQWTMNVSAVAHVNDACVLEFLKQSFGGRIRPQGQSDNVQVWIRSIGYQNRDFALKFLPNLAKHSKLKREKIDAIIHHHRQRLTVPGVERNYCSIENCGRPAVGYKMCGMHYQRWRRHGDPLYVSDSLNASLRV
jgi:hypothetical protein